MFCEKCGSQLTEGSKFCMTCGAKIDQKEAEQETAASVESSSAAVDPVQAFVPPAQPQTAQPQTAQPQTAQPAPSETEQQSRPQQNMPPAQPQPKPVQQVQPQSAQQANQPVKTVQAGQAQHQINQNIPQQPVYQSASTQQAAAPQPVMSRKPASITPLPVWKYIGIFILSGIPVLGLVMLFAWSFGKSFNMNTRNYARAVLITALIVIILSAAGYIAFGSALTSILNNYGIFIE